MNKFESWLDKNPGEAAKLTIELDVNATCISNVKHERRPMPTRWMPVLKRKSGGLLTEEYMIGLRNRVAKKIKKSKG